MSRRCLVARQASLRGEMPSTCRSSAAQAWSWSSEKNFACSGKRACSEAAHSRLAAACGRRGGQGLGDGPRVRRGAESTRG